MTISVEFTADVVEIFFFKEHSVSFRTFYPCLEPAFLIVFSPVPKCISRPYPDHLPDRFTNFVPDLFPTRSMIPSSQEIVNSRPVP